MLPFLTSNVKDCTVHMQLSIAGKVIWEHHNHPNFWCLGLCPTDPLKAHNTPKTH